MLIVALTMWVTMHGHGKCSVKITKSGVFPVDRPGGGCILLLLSLHAVSAPLPAALVRRGDRRLLHRSRRQRAGARLRLFRGRARSLPGGPSCSPANEPRRIAANIAKLPELLGGRAMRDEATAVRSDSPRNVAAAHYVT